MQGATHFIEQYRDIEDGPLEIQQSIAIFRIESLDKILAGSKSLHLKTIAVWKIKYKDQKQTEKP